MPTRPTTFAGASVADFSPGNFGAESSRLSAYITTVSAHSPATDDLGGLIDVVDFAHPFFYCSFPAHCYLDQAGSFLKGLLPTGFVGTSLTINPQRPLGHAQRQLHRQPSRAAGLLSVR